MICKMCGATERLQWIESTKAELIKHQLCFTCNFWRERLERHQDNPNSVIIDNTAYMIGREDELHVFRGFGGARFVICFDDGREVVTTNLWCQGGIPDIWKPFFRNNAHFGR